MRSITSPNMMLSSCTAILLAANRINAQPLTPDAKAVALPVPATGASIPHQPSFGSFSYEPAFWVEFFGNRSTPNELTFAVLDQIIAHGGRPIIRPGGDTMDSMIFNASAGDPMRDQSGTGGIYRTTVGPDYYKSWSNFPAGTKFVSTLNFQNNSYDIALDMALASVTYQRNKIAYFELGNEPTNYAYSRWNDSTIAYVNQWKSWTTGIDSAVNATLTPSEAKAIPEPRWLGSSATTDQSGMYVRPADIIPLGIDSNDQIGELSIHSYPFSSCDPARAALASIPHILNHTSLLNYAVTQIGPSAAAALAAGNKWIIGEFNSISCSGFPNVTDTFAQALWAADSYLIYATMNASAVHLHQGATLVLQSGNQVNSAGVNGTPGFSAYDFLYPRDSPKRGPARVLPSFSGQLFIAEAFATPNTQIAAVATPAGVDPDYFSAYAFYNHNKLSKLAILNLNPYFANSTSSYTIKFDISGAQTHAGKNQPVFVKRLTAPHVDEGNGNKTTWAGQTFPRGKAKGNMEIEEVGTDGVVKVRGSEAVLVFFGEDGIFRQ